MSKHLVRDLESLQRQILAMAGSVEEAIYKSIQALQEHDKAIANEVIAGDNKVDELDNLVSEEVDRYNDGIIEELLERMKTSPNEIEASMSLFSAVRHLERIADHATNIAEDVLYLVDGEIVRHRLQGIPDD